MANKRKIVFIPCPVEGCEGTGVQVSNGNDDSYIWCRCNVCSKLFSVRKETREVVSSEVK